MRYLVMIAVASVAGCDDPPGLCSSLACGGSTEAETAFAERVLPVLVARCAECHSSTGPAPQAGGWVGDAGDGREILLGTRAAIATLSPFDAPLIQRMAENDRPDYHQETFENAELQGILDWMALERGERGPDDNELSEANSTVVHWAGCLTFADFQATNMMAWAAIPTTANVACRGCHAGGEFGFTAASDPAGFFAAITERRRQLLQYFDVDFAASPIQIVANERGLERVAESFNPHQAHPRFNLTISAAPGALRDWAEAAQRRLDTHDCGPSPLLD